MKWRNQTTFIYSLADRFADICCDSRRMITFAYWLKTCFCPAPPNINVKIKRYSPTSLPQFRVKITSVLYTGRKIIRTPTQSARIFKRSKNIFWSYRIFTVNRLKLSPACGKMTINLGSPVYFFFIRGALSHLPVDKKHKNCVKEWRSLTNFAVWSLVYFWSIDR